MSQPTETESRKLVSTKHDDLHAAAAIYDILEELPEPKRLRVIAWVNDQYGPPKE